MKQRNPLAVFLLSTITLGIYSIYWLVQTKKEMNERGASIPTAWLIIVPFVSIWWLWKYCEGVEMVTSSKISTVLGFIIVWLTGSIGHAIIQDSFNKVTTAAPVSSQAPTPVSDNYPNKST